MGFIQVFVAVDCPVKACMCEQVSKKWGIIIRSPSTRNLIWRRMWVARGWVAPGIRT